MYPPLRFTILLIISALILMWYAFYNGYPLVTGDTGAYILYAFKGGAANDRSVFYSFFMAVAGLRTLDFAGVRGSIWLPVFFQCAIVSWLLYRHYVMLSGHKPTWLIWLLIMAVIALATGVSWTAAYCMPDIFTGILLLAFLLYLADNTASAVVRRVYLLLAGLAILVHNSHYLLMPLLILCILIITVIKKEAEFKRKITHMLYLTAFCWLFICAYNKVNGHGFTLSRSSHVFMIGKLAEAGVLQQYLEDNCDKKPTKLCAYKDELPTVAYQYIWSDSGPFYKIGGWDSSAVVHKPIIKDIFTSPEYVWMFARQSLKHTFYQLGFVSVGQDEQALGVGTSPFNHIDLFIKSEIPQYRKSRQMSGTLNNYCWIWGLNIFLVISSLWVVILMIQSPGMRKKVVTLYIVIIIFLVCNAAVVATFANVLDRLQHRVFWVVPATNLLVLVAYYLERRNRDMHLK